VSKSAIAFEFSKSKKRGRAGASPDIKYAEPTKMSKTKYSFHAACFFLMLAKSRELLQYASGPEEATTGKLSSASK